MGQMRGLELQHAGGLRHQQQQAVLAAQQRQPISAAFEQADPSAIMRRLDRLVAVPAAAAAGLTEELIDSFTTLYFIRLQDSARQGLVSACSCRNGVWARVYGCMLMCTLLHVLVAM